ncbi:hypothetical protein KIN20_038102 [Parelaphostrongylus tenuis]|uniref:Uncharacterized protein n=1 Tax=Parelaphostrongylus tenuis TaxID=148309 RepID=A0AAD5RF13_PARTN|nr:hypothetical protein KIN20_038102 [Parelaphostrongylus tenuis]
MSKPKIIAQKLLRRHLRAPFLAKVGSLVGGGDSELLGILRPYYSIVDMSANGNKQVKASASSIEKLENPPHICVLQPPLYPSGAAHTVTIPPIAGIQVRFVRSRYPVTGS